MKLNTNGCNGSVIKHGWKLGRTLVSSVRSSSASSSVRPGGRGLAALPTAPSTGTSDKLSELSTTRPLLGEFSKTSSLFSFLYFLWTEFSQEKQKLGRRGTSPRVKDEEEEEGGGPDDQEGQQVEEQSDSLEKDGWMRERERMVDGGHDQQVGEECNSPLDDNEDDDEDPVLPAPCIQLVFLSTPGCPVSRLTCFCSEPSSLIWTQPIFSFLSSHRRKHISDLKDLHHVALSLLHPLLLHQSAQTRLHPSLSYLSQKSPLDFPPLRYQRLRLPAQSVTDGEQVLKHCPAQQVLSVGETEIERDFCAPTHAVEEGVVGYEAQWKVGVVVVQVKVGWGWTCSALVSAPAVFPNSPDPQNVVVFGAQTRLGLHLPPQPGSQLLDTGQFLWWGYQLWNGFYTRVQVLGRGFLMLFWFHVLDRVLFGFLWLRFHLCFFRNLFHNWRETTTPVKTQTGQELLAAITLGRRGAHCSLHQFAVGLHAVSIATHQLLGMACLLFLLSADSLHHRLQCDDDEDNVCKRGHLAGVMSPKHFTERTCRTLTDVDDVLHQQVPRQTVDAVAVQHHFMSAGRTEETPAVLGGDVELGLLVHGRPRFTFTAATVTAATQATATITACGQAAEDEQGLWDEEGGEVHTVQLLANSPTD
ncbi:hypothetical protein FQN60_009094, partial [Etheostoma spectabile]